jgi:hypothetical protein
MSPVFATIRFGPFSTDYHRRAIDAGFREALGRYLTEELLPQVDEPFESTSGSLTALVGDERFCGPNSLVKDVYKLEFRFKRAGSCDEVSGEIRRDLKTGSFRPRYPHSPLFLWTARRRAENAAFEAIARRARAGETGPWPCPRCGSVLKLSDLPELFDLACPRGCFALGFHRDPATGALRHGHFFSGPPMKRE